MQFDLTAHQCKCVSECWLLCGLCVKPPLAGWLQAVRVVSKRQLKLVWRDKVLLRGRMLQVRR